MLVSPKSWGAIAALTMLGLAVGAWWWSGASPTPPRTSVTAANLKFGGPFTLVDHTGKMVSERNFIGQYQLIFFGFTDCPAVCPTTLQTITLALVELGPLASEVRPIFISVDPQHDSPKVLADYISNFDRRIVALTGTPEQVAAAAKIFHVHYRRARDKDGNEQIEHTATIFLMARDGTYLGDIFPDVSPRKMAAIIRPYLEKLAKQSVTEDRR